MGNSIDPRFSDSITLIPTHHANINPSSPTVTRSSNSSFRSSTASISSEISVLSSLKSEKEIVEKKTADVQQIAFPIIQSQTGNNLPTSHDQRLVEITIEDSTPVSVQQIALPIIQAPPSNGNDGNATPQGQAAEVNTSTQHVPKVACPIIQAPHSHNNDIGGTRHVRQTFTYQRISFLQPSTTELLRAGENSSDTKIVKAVAGAAWTFVTLIVIGAVTGFFNR